MHARNALPDAETGSGEPRTPGVLSRLWPVLALAAVAAAAIWLAGDWLSFAALERNYESMLAWRTAHPLAAMAGFALAYALSVAVSLPGAVWLTLVGGFLFGVVTGTVLVVLSATAGATAVFLIARTSAGRLLHERAGPWLARMERGFREGEVSFLLVMRLVPAVPFFVANLAPAFLGARLSTFVWTTLVGIVPGTLVYISIGAGLGEQLSRGEPPDLGVIFEPHVLGPLIGLAVLASLPQLLRRFRRGRI